MAEWIIEAGPEPGARRIIKDGVDITGELSALTLTIDRSEVRVIVEYTPAAVTVLADDDQNPPSLQKGEPT